MVWINFMEMEMIKTLFVQQNSRRSFLRGTTVAMLSTGAVLLLAGQEAGAAGSTEDAASAHPKSR